MAWRIEFLPTAGKALERLDPTAQRRIIAFLETRVAPAPNPLRLGEALRGGLRTFWKYRVGDYRIICELKDEVLTVLVVKVGHRREVYR